MKCTQIALLDQHKLTVVQKLDYALTFLQVLKVGVVLSTFQNIILDVKKLCKSNLCDTGSNQTVPDSP